MGGGEGWEGRFGGVQVGGASKWGDLGWWGGGRGAGGHKLPLPPLALNLIFHHHKPNPNLCS